MVNNPDRLKEIYQEIQNQFVQKLQNSRGVFGHPGTKGEVSESEWIGLLTDYLPHRYKAGRAFVMDFEGNESDQIDLVVYDSHFTPRLYAQNGNQFIPAESVYAVFEVKQNLSREHIEYAKSKAESVRKLKRTTDAVIHAGGQFEARQPPEILAGILTYESDYSPAISLVAQKNIMEEDKLRLLNLGCIANSSSFYIDDGKIITSENLPIAIFFMNLVRMLARMGSAPPIKYSEYLKSLGE